MLQVKEGERSKMAVRFGWRLVPFIEIYKTGGEKSSWSTKQDSPLDV